MKEERNTREAWLRVSVAIILTLCVFSIGCKHSSVSAAAAPDSVPRTEDPATRELRAIGDRAVIAIMARDVNTLLEYDHDPDDAASLKKKSGDLYCYLFDSSCIPGASQRAVYDIFTTAPRLGIDASVAHMRGRDYGLLMFYDKSQISGQELYSPDFLCSEKARRATTTWRFVAHDGKWSTSTLFEYKTDRPCKMASAD